MIDFSTLQGLTIPEGVVTQITDAAGNVLWSAVELEPIVLEVAKITSNTYVGETTYTGEEFILLDIYPKSANSTANVTYGGLTKTLTFSGTNAQQVYFGTFGGTSDDTPASGTLTIEGGCAAFGCGGYKASSNSKAATVYCECITAVNEWGNVTYIPSNGFNGCEGMTSISVSPNITSIGDKAFYGANFCTSMIFKSIPSFGQNVFYAINNIGTWDYSRTRAIYFEMENFDWDKWASCNPPYYYYDSYESNTNGQITFSQHVYINGVDGMDITSIKLTNCTSISDNAFLYFSDLTSATIPDSVMGIGKQSFYRCDNLTSVTFDNTSGWYVTTTLNGDASTGTAVDVTDPENNATLLTNTYKDYYWYRS